MNERSCLFQRGFFVFAHCIENKIHILSTFSLKKKWMTTQRTNRSFTFNQHHFTTLILTKKMDVSPNQNDSDLFEVMNHHQEVHFGIRSSPYCEDDSRSAKVLDTVCAAWSLVALIYAIPTSSKSHLHNNRSPLSLMS